MAPSGKNDRSPADEELARLRLAADTAREAARWLRSNLRRVEEGHVIEVEVRSAVQALEGALESIRDQERPGPQDTG